jgi:hypothetical protein
MRRLIARRTKGGIESEFDGHFASAQREVKQRIARLGRVHLSVLQMW